ncbi:hypothetical protein [Flavobacterium sp. HJJ]|uniref:hypothetical protein n=1 Tax=Flavobacterium sp. HJJ TaxID=2783792 RepID=UPI00188D6DE0|nr:hypothetical protein [Flavobacterium sp. HJJ]MBF4471565.1 hypothetical protein [Flavobacterium sp. HJJ]
MKKNIFLSFLIIIAVNSINAQSTGVTKSLISSSAIVKKYHQKAELEKMKKGELIDLYIERINIIINRVPFIALTNKRGVSINDLGIPSTSNNIKLVENQQENIKVFLEGTEKFERSLAPFADTPDLINAIIYLESMLKELKMIRE